MNYWLIIIFTGVFSFLFSQQDNSDASFPGGEKALQEFLVENLNFPEICLDMQAGGKVYMKFMVEKDGSITQIELEANNTDCDAFVNEARRVIELMPTWIPGTIAGDITKLQCILPINFVNPDFSEGETEDNDFFEPNWAGIELGIGQLFNSNGSSTFDQNRFWENEVGKSLVFNYNLFEYKFPIFKQHLGITTGLGYSLKGIGIKTNYQLVHTPDSVYAVDGLSNVRKNKITSHFITIPLLLEFATKKDTKKNFYVSAGVIGSWRLSTYLVQKGTDTNGDNFTHFTYSNYNLSRFSLEGTVRAGYSYIGVFAAYQFTSLFQKNKTVGVFPLRIGLSINVDYFQ
ncbi:MAG: outer membrane beta-barrel protein [Crocinitomicaceae bacterium]|nr:outer membrane beta-barrel protein [Crocinitomicaceae bacterium]